MYKYILNNDKELKTIADYMVASVVSQIFMRLNFQISPNFWSTVGAQWGRLNTHIHTHTNGRDMCVWSNAIVQEKKWEKGKGKDTNFQNILLEMSLQIEIHINKEINVTFENINV